MEALWARLRRRTVASVDVLLAVVLTGLAAEGSWAAAADHGQSLDGLGFALVGVAGVGLTLRRLRPLIALAICFTATLGYLLSGHPYSPILQLTSVALYSVGAWRPTRTALGAAGLTAAAYLPIAVFTERTLWAGWGVPALAGVWLVAPCLAGIAVRRYRALRKRAAEAERREHVYAERLRIAREVHDVVGHGLAVINLQAGVALHVLATRPERAAEALRAVRQASGQALGELRTVLTADDLRPVPGLAELPALVAAVRTGGAAVTLDIEGEPEVVPAAIGAAAYRVIQEALTNVVRHSDADRSHVRVDCGEAALTVTVTDDGRGTPGPAAAGRGLIGMAERVNAVGGTLSTGNRPGGGYAVRAWLPLAGQAGAG